MTHALIYLSELAQPLDKEDIIEIATKATVKNKKIGITGFLTSRNNKFVQFLEGEKEPLDRLMATIAADPRHTVLHTIHLTSLLPQFANWNMRYIATEDGSRATMDDTLIQTIEHLTSENYDQQLVEAQVYTIINRISRILYLPKLD